MSLALFDFDGTLTRRDSLLHFTEYAVGRTRLVAGLMTLSPWLVAMRSGLVSNHRTKERYFARFFGGMEATRFEAVARRYALERLDRIVSPVALDRLEWHRRAGHTVVVVSASCRQWLEPWCTARGAALICTELEVDEGRITGRLAGPNCHGPQKVVRIRAELDPERFERVFAYGDSRGDREMLAIADEPFYRTFG